MLINLINIFLIFKIKTKKTSHIVIINNLLIYTKTNEKYRKINAIYLKYGGKLV